MERKSGPTVSKGISLFHMSRFSGARAMGNSMEK
jgi:hypothetical protein